MELLNDDLKTSSVPRVAHMQEPAPVTLPPGGELVKQNTKKGAAVKLSLDTLDLEVMRRRWKQKIIKDCRAADTINLKVSADDPVWLGIRVLTSV